MTGTKLRYLQIEDTGFPLLSRRWKQDYLFLTASLIITGKKLQVHLSTSDSGGLILF